MRSSTVRVVQNIYPVTKRNDLVRMEIEDQGIGIPQNEYHKIFQRFYRGSSKEVMEKSGTGIGLFLSREIIEKHAGTITVTFGKRKRKHVCDSITICWLNFK